MPTGNIGIILGAILFGALFGFIGSTATVVVKDLENGQLFDGDVGVNEYLGNIITGTLLGAATGAALGLGAAIGAAAATVQAVMVGAAIGGLVAGGVELVTQGITTNWETVDYGSLAIESFTGSLYGGASGGLNTTMSVGVRLAMRGTTIATSGINAASHGINDNKSFGDILLDVGISVGVGFITQGTMVGVDAFTGKLSKTILESYALDGVNFMLKNKILVGIISILKNASKNKDKWFEFIFN